MRFDEVAQAVNRLPVTFRDDALVRENLNKLHRARQLLRQGLSRTPGHPSHHSAGCTTLPARDILQTYLRRWRLEMCLDDLKTTLEMEMLCSRTPKMLPKELYSRLIDHNLIRCVMAEVSAQHSVPLERISFKGTLDARRQFTQAMSQARAKKKRSQLWTKLLETLADDLLPERPARREPRAVKRVKNKYPRLSAPRHQFNDRPKRNRRRTISRMRKLGLT